MGGLWNSAIMPSYWPIRVRTLPCTCGSLTTTMARRAILLLAPEVFQSAPPAPTRVWLVRHGRSTFNAQGLYQGCCDQPELTERGRLDSRLAAQALAGARIRFVVASPLRRALDTAGEILDEFRRERLPIPSLQIDDRLREIDL